MENDVLQEADERLLIQKLKAGDTEGFAALFEAHASRLYKIALRMCASREDAEDIVQQTFLQAYMNIGSFKSESSLYTWLYAIAKNQCLRLLENRQRSRFSVMDKLIAQAQTAETADCFTAAEKQCYVNQVKDGCLLGMLICLPFHQRMAFILHVLLGIKVKHTAAIIGKSENAVRLLVHRARHSLKAFLCKHCSLYDTRNPCRCENLIHFSLKQGWIHGAADMPADHRLEEYLREAEQEIGGLQKIAALFHTLPEPSLDAINRIRDDMMNQPYRIFSEKQ